jgi:hypothetical protein
MPNPGNMMQMLGMLPKFMHNPMAAMMECGMNVPQNIQDNPQAITNYLLNSGQMTQEQYNTVSSLANMAQNFIGKKF